MSKQAMNTEKKQVPPWERIAVDAETAAQMLSCGRSTFFARVKRGLYPKPGIDGRWSVSALRALHQANQGAVFLCRSMAYRLDTMKSAQLGQPM